MRRAQTDFHFPALAVLVIALAVARPCQATQEKILHNFNLRSGDGYQPEAGLIFDAAGNLYGTTQFGGTFDQGTVFELSPRASGGWTEKTLHSFDPDSGDGGNPHSDLVFDADGNLYGTTGEGGANQLYGGTVFKLSPEPGGGWKELVLHKFGNPGDGFEPEPGLVMDTSGNLFGVTSGGGSHGQGIAFELSPNTSGEWTERVLHAFGSGTDGAAPSGSLVTDKAGNLYGVTNDGGTSDVGTVYKLTPGANGSWRENVLYSFNDLNQSAGGKHPVGYLVVDSSGTIFGAASFGGYCPPCVEGAGGTIFELVPAVGGRWHEKLLHTFKPDEGDGAFPRAGLIADDAGSLYGTTESGGEGGTAFELTLVNGVWSEKLLHFFGSGSDGNRLFGKLVRDAAGNIYGTTANGGASGGGIVFEITTH